MRTFKIYSLSIFQICRIMLLTLVTKPQVTLSSHYSSLFTYRCRLAEGWATLIPQHTAHLHSWKGVGWPLRNTSLFSLHLQFHSCSPFPIVFPMWMGSINLNKCAWMCMMHTECACHWWIHSSDSSGLFQLPCIPHNSPVEAPPYTHSAS